MRSLKLVSPEVKFYERVKIFGVNYTHIKFDNDDDLYVTGYGLTFIENLKPENIILDQDWFRNNSIRLSGTSCLYKVRTKEVNGVKKEIVLKWNRMGQDVPNPEKNEELMFAEFNSPFEEFALVKELRDAISQAESNIIIQKPLAIYVPGDTVEFWQTGRILTKMKQKMLYHKDVDLDLNRSYAVIYEWIEGIDASEAFRQGLMEKDFVDKLLEQTEQKLKEKGFHVRDNKAHHIIVRPLKKGGFRHTRSGDLLYGLVDFELLERTPDREERIRRQRRIDYLKRQRDRFRGRYRGRIPSHLKHVRILGVDYIYGHVESTKGRLWVVGKDPYLFDYFLPERWENSPRTRISAYSQMYYTVTKDNIHLVWKLSRVGLQPDMDPFKEDEKRILEYGYNSPFEEFALAIELSAKGFPTIYPRAIYMTGNKTEISGELFDNSRYESHKSFETPDGLPVLKKNRDYITIWGYWNGPDEKLAINDGDYYEGIDALRAYREGIIGKDEYIALLEIAKKRLLEVGVEDLNLRGNHILLSLNSKRRLIRDSEGIPEIRLCNFEFLRKL